MLAGCDRVPATMGNASHGWSGCSATNPGPSKDGKERKPLCLTFSGSSSSH
jgi:hypothetical protein